MVQSRRFFQFLPLLLGLAPAITAAPPEPKFLAVDIDRKVAIGYGVALADVDGDGKTDILLADQHQFRWYQNPGWTKHLLAENLTRHDNVCIAARDMDGDGKAEIAVGAEWNPGDTIGSGAIFYLVPPTDRTQPWTPVELPHEPVVHRMHWLKDWQGNARLVVLPLHGRGNRNGEGAGVKILGYQMPPDPKQPWPTVLLGDSLHLTHNFDPVHWNDNPEEQFLVAAKEGVFVSQWIDGRHQLLQIAGNENDNGFTGAGEVRSGKLPGGRNFLATVEPMHGNQLAIYTPPRGSSQKFWTRHVLSGDLNQGHALACGDLLGIGSDQIVVGWREKNKEGKVGLWLFTPLDAEGKEWRKSVVDDNTMACEDLKLVDLDSDGRLDIVAAGRATHNLKAYFNQSKPNR